MLNSKRIYTSTTRRHLGLGSFPLPRSLFYCLFSGLPARFFQQQLMSRPWSLFSSSAGSLREMCMVSLISKMVVWLARSRICASSQRGWWCLDQACSVIADFCLYSSCGCLVLLQTRLQCPLCSLDVLWPTPAEDLVHHSQCFQCRVSDLDPALARAFIRTA